MSTKSPKSDKQYVWEGEANASSYTIREETDPEKQLPRGTCLTLYLKVSLDIFVVFFVVTYLSNVHSVSCLLFSA